MKHLDLFSGIGGFALAARWMGWETIQFVEIDKFCQKVLNKNFPNVPIHGDIKTFDGSKYRGTVDILTGGFPCQPFSVAGKRKGKEDDRHLWPEMFRVIGEIKPRWIVGENVTGIIGLALNDVLTALEDKGYNTETYIIPACSLNAPHRRDRIWILANSESNRDKRIGRAVGEAPRRSEKQNDGLQSNGESKNGMQVLANTYNQRCEEFNATEIPSRSFVDRRGVVNYWNDWPSEPALRGSNDGLPNELDRIKSLGNAIVPQVAFEIFKAIESVYEKERQNK
jgi:DNA (cytosine-5)-methyltransferase 1